MTELLGFQYRFEPRGGGGRTLLLLHGTGGNEADLLPLGRVLDPEASLLSPRGKVIENGYPRFFRRFAEGVLDIDDLKVQTKDLVGFIDAAATEHGIARESVVAVGYSNGANIAASTLLLFPKALHAAVLFRPMFAFEPDESPALDGVPVLILSGTNDPLIDRGQPERLAGTLKGADVSLNWSPAGHQLARDEIERARTWLQDLQ